jgi:hypothetical protein
LHKEWNGKIQSPPRSISDPAGCFWTNPNIPYYWQNPHIIFPYILVITGLSNPKYHIIYIYILCMYVYWPILPIPTQAPTYLFVKSHQTCII